MVHMDIKSANVLLQNSMCQVAKIADLGVSRYLVEGSLINFTLQGAHQFTFYTYVDETAAGEESQAMQYTRYPGLHGARAVFMPSSQAVGEDRCVQARHEHSALAGLVHVLCMLCRLSSDYAVLECCYMR